MSNLINTGSNGITGRACMEGLEDRRLFSTLMVNNTNDSGTGSLRQALLNANNNAGADTIKFSIGSGAKTITPYSQLPIISGPVVIDGTSQPGYAGKPIIEINGSSAGSGFVNGIWLDGGSSVVKGLVLNRFAGSGVFINTRGGNTVYNCYIGTDISGSYAKGNQSHGMLVQSGGNLISHNVISGNGGQGVCLYTSSASGNRIEGNYIGTNAAGTGKIGNAKSGVHVFGAANTTIGGAIPGSGNLISGNREDGIVINQGGATNNYILGNRIGLTALGNKRLGNGMYGVEISQPNNIVGGGAKGWGNVISANGLSGVVLWLSSANGNQIMGNYIGTDVTGKRDLGNLTRGVEATNGAYNNIIGGSTARMRNVISGNDQGGIGIYSGSWGNRVQNNFVGLTTTGHALPNGVLGVILTDNAGTNTLILRAGTQTTSNGVLPNDKALL